VSVIITGIVTTAVLLAGLASCAGAHATRADTHAQTYLQLNICGNACNSGGPAVIANVARSIRARALGHTGQCAVRSPVDERVGTARRNESTCGQHKIDYLFFAGAAFTGCDWSSTTVQTSDAAAGLSDHRALWATVRVC
jgi:hypothetical protein